MLKTPFLAIALCATQLAFGAGDPDAGKTRAAVCTSCHGAEGCSANPLWPNLAGQKDPYLAKQMKMFRDGTRQDPLMSAMAKPLSDEDIANLSAYFSAAAPCQ